MKLHLLIAADNLALYVYMKCFPCIIPVITFPHEVLASFWLISELSFLSFSEIPTLLCQMSVHLVTGCISLI